MLGVNHPTASGRRLHPSDGGLHSAASSTSNLLPSSNSTTPAASAGTTSLHLLRLLSLPLIIVTSLLYVLTRLGSTGSLSAPPDALVLRNLSRGPSFPRTGLKPSLWKDLDAVPWRNVILHPLPTPFVNETNENSTVPWTHARLLPPTALTTLSGLPKPYPQHKIATLPREAVVGPNAPIESKLMFGLVTTVERAIEMSVLWDRWLIPPPSVWPQTPESREIDTLLPRPACLLMLGPKENGTSISQLRRVLSALDIVCQVKVSQVERYEVRVLSMVKEMKDYAAELGCVLCSWRTAKSLLTIGPPIAWYRRTFDWYIFNDE